MICNVEALGWQPLSSGLEELAAIIFQAPVSNLVVCYRTGGVCSRAFGMSSISVENTARY